MTGHDMTKHGEPRQGRSRKLFSNPSRTLRK